jgi:hypothetical protein
MLSGTPLCDVPPAAEETSGTGAADSIDALAADDLHSPFHRLKGSGSWSLQKRIVSPGSSASSALKIAAWRNLLATPRASKG